MTQKHPFHLVDPSPWPLVRSTSAFIVTRGAVGYFHGFSSGGLFILLGFIFLVLSIFVWWRDIIREGTFEGQHTSIVQLGLRFGIMLFIVSEVIFFFAFFWAFFWGSLSPTPRIGSIWPPVAIEVLSVWEIPFLNTILLLFSGVTVTWCHHSIIIGNRYQALISLFCTISLALVFSILQCFEYFTAPFNISDSIYGSVFYMATGFHGFHVAIGTLFLWICWVRLFFYHFTRQHHFGFESAVWYWHFVDLVWLFLFISVYWWGGLFEIVV
jgi:cytochrome c oxidase subunit 3